MQKFFENVKGGKKDLVKQAICSQKKKSLGFVHFIVKYRKLADEEERDLRFEPYYVRIMDRAWYLVAWSFKRSAFRTHRLDRIDTPRVEKETFDPWPFDPDEDFRGAFGPVIDVPQRLRLRFTELRFTHYFCNWLAVLPSCNSEC